MLQWQRFTIDLLRVGIKPRSLASEAGTPEPARDAGFAGGARDAAADSELSDAEASDAMPEHESDPEERAADREPSEPSPQDEDAPQEASTTRAPQRKVGANCALANVQAAQRSLAGWGPLACWALIAARRLRQRTRTEQERSASHRAARAHSP
jgi:hypothetical protein